MQHYPLALLDTLVFLLTTCVVLLVGRFFRISSAFGYLLSGFFLGPHFLRLVSDVDSVRLLGELGVLFLLFKVGLELPLRRLRVLSRYILGLGAVQVGLTSLTLTILLYVFLGLDSPSAWFAGTVLTFSSTALVLQLLNERSELNTRLGRVVFSILLFQDFFVIILFAISTFDGSPETSFWLQLLLFGIRSFGGILGLFILGRMVVLPFFNYFFPEAQTDFFIAGIFSVLFGFNYVAFCLGVPVELGAFVAGLSLAGTSYRQRVESEIKPFQGLFLGCFFIIIGLETRLDLVFQNTWAIIWLLTLMLSVKAFILFLSGQIFQLSASLSLRSAILLSGCGEFTFILFAFPNVRSWIGEETVQLLCTVATISMICTPCLAYLFESGRMIFGFREDENSDMPEPAVTTMEESALELLNNHIIIVGLGDVGRMAYRVLSEEGVSCVGIDRDAKTVNQTRKRGWQGVFFGDASHEEFFEFMQVSRAHSIFVACKPGPQFVEVMRLLHEKYPHLLSIAQGSGRADHDVALKSIGVCFLDSIVPDGNSLKKAMRLSDRE